MAVRQFRLPDPGEGLTEAELVTWHVAVGDTVKVNDVVVEIETAKSLVELPVPFAGVVTELLADEGSTVEVGTPIISIEDGVGVAAVVADEPPASRAQEPGMVGSPAPKLEAEARATAGEAPYIEEGKIGGTTSTGRTAVLVGYGVKQTEAKRRPRTGSSTSAGEPVASPENVTLDPRTVVRQSATLSGDPIMSRPLAKPPVRKLAKDLGVDLGAVAGTGAGGVVTRSDVEAHADRAANSGDSTSNGTVAHSDSPAGHDHGTPDPTVQGERETRIPVKGVRKMTAQAMVGSAFTAPHVTMFNTIDVTATMDLVARLKSDREFRDVKVTPMLVLAKALCVAVRRNPGMNAVWDEAAQEIVVKSYVNLGIAAATPRGLVVPNIKDADRMSMLHLAQEIGALTETARAGRTQPAQMSGGTITITNVGVFGVDTGTPIINPGESAIVAFGAVKKKPWVVTDRAGHDTIAIRQVTQLAVSFDHRLIDGELGSRFLADLSALLEDPSRALVWG